MSRAGGSVQANLDRWRGQFGLGHYERAEFEALERRPVMGIDSLIVEFDGPATVSGQQVEDARLLAAVVPGRIHVFVKMTGPREAVAEQKGRFYEFLDGLERSTPIAAAPPAGPPAGPSASGQQKGRLAWDLPPGWVQGESTSSMRLATFNPGGDQSVQAYLVILSGAAGGPIANLRRWNGQVGVPGPSEEEFAALRRIELFGAKAPLLESYGSSQAIVGTLARLGSNSLFVKMVGPSDAVRQHVESFVAFCASMEVDG